MKELDDLEEELKALQPKGPTPAFTARVEDALGDSGSVSFRRISSDSPKRAGSKLYFLIPPALALAASLVWMLSFLPKQTGLLETSPEPADHSSPIAEVMEDLDSPLHGVSLEELETYSGMPTEGWADPQVRELLLDRVDEGLIQRPGFSPGRQVRYHYLDETHWMHPASNTLIISTTPRQEVIILDLDLY